MSLRNSYYWNTNYPKMRIDVSYSQTGRTGTTATYKVDMAVYFTSTGWHGYGLSANVNINGATQALRIKEPSNTWSGSGHKGTWSFNVTAPAGTGGGTLPASIALWGTEGDSTNIQSGAKTVSLSTWNTAPTWSSNDGNINGWKENKVIPENTSTVTVNIPSATDKEGNTVYYDVYRYVNGASNAKIASGTTSRSITDNLSGFGQGTQIKYFYASHDGSLWTSGDRWSWVYTKNTFTPANIAVSGGINYDTTGITVTASGAKNTNGDGSFTYTLATTSGITVNNGSFTPNSSGQITLSIYKSGTRPSNPHIDFNALKSHLSGKNFAGVITLRLTTRNAYGSSNYKEIAVPVDLRTAPVTATLNNPTGATTVAGGSYFVHNLSTVGVSWSAGTDKLGAGSLSYELQYKYGTGSWNRLTSTTGTSWSGKLPQVSSATTCYFRVITSTVYGYSSTSSEKSITMHYYNPPNVVYGTTNRTQSAFSVVITSTTNTSISAVAISSRTYTGLSGTSKSFAGSPTTITDSGLTGSSSYNLTVKITDNSGLSNATTTLTVPVKTYIPILSITDKGIGISNVADSRYTINMGGAINISASGDNAVLMRFATERTWSFRQGGTGSTSSLDLVSESSDKSFRILNTPRNKGVIISVSDTSATRVTIDNNNVYHAGNKPSANDVGALPITGGTLTGSIAVPSISAIGGTGAFLNKDTLRLEKGYGGKYSQIFFKGQQDDDGRIIHYENANASQLWLIPSDDAGATNDEVVVGALTGKNALTDFSGGTWTRSVTMNTRGQIKLDSTTTPTITFNPTTNPSQNSGGRLIFNSLDNQNCQIRHEWYDGSLAPFGFIIEKAPGNTQGYNAGLKMEGHIEIGQYGSAGNMSTVNHANARLVRGNTDGAGSVKLQMGGTSAGSASFEIVNPQWDNAWFSCGVSGIKAKSYANFSDATLKTNIEKVSTPISERMKSIAVYNYNYKSDFEPTMGISLDDKPVLLQNSPETRWGVLAQEVEEIFPELIIESETLVDGENKVVKSVDVYGLTVLTLEYAKELQAENESLKERLALIEERLGIA